VFGGLDMPIFLLTVFAKNDKDNLTKSEQAELVAMSKALVARYGGSR
jgi:hypothetical protein